ncbi:hypothetical protein GCM10027051_02570 [Niabella terrae]
MTPIKIPIDKRKAIRMFVFFVIAVILCSFMVTHPQYFVKGNHYGFVRGCGYVGTVIFVLAATIVSNKVFKRKPGLLIDDAGITDNSMGVLFAQVPWEEIAGIKKMHGAGENFLTVMLRHPEAYIQQETNTVKRKMLELNYQSLKTPVNIAVSRLRTDAAQLFETVKSAYEQQQQKAIRT